MKISLKGLALAALGAGTVFAYSSNGVLAASHTKHDASIIGEAGFVVSFQSNKKMKQYEDKLLKRQNRIETNMGKGVKFKRKTDKELRSAFHSQTKQLVENFPFVTIKIDGKKVTTDAHGEFSITGITPGTHEIQMAQSGSTFYERAITLHPGKNKIFLMTGTKAKDMGKNMSKNMNMSKGSMNMQKNMNMSKGSMNTTITKTLSPSTVIGGGGGYSPGTYIGSGLGSMMIIDWAQHVSCNKSSNGDGGSNFPFNNSDCAVSISDGELYANHPFLYSQYKDGIYCVEESMNRVFRTENEGSQNVYCDYHPASDGTKPKISYYHGYENEGFNCSSFPFLNHDERYRPYSNLG